VTEIDLNGLVENAVVGGNTVTQSGTATNADGDEMAWNEVTFQVENDNGYTIQPPEDDAVPADTSATS